MPFVAKKIKYCPKSLEDKRKPLSYALINELKRRWTAPPRANKNFVKKNEP